jgi:hypothetical protein
MPNMHFSVVQNWPHSNFQPQLFNDTTQQPLSFANDFIHPPSTQPGSALPSTSHTPPAKVIGTISHQAESDNYIFKCSIPRCKHKTFTRWYDLRRHHDGTHSNDGPEFWCHVNGCERSETPGGRSFPRKDKLSDHVRNAHRGDERVMEIEMLRTRRI